MELCVVCGSDTTALIRVESDRISSLSKLHEEGAETFLCQECSHVQTKVSVDEANYYADNYQISLKHEDDDQVYDIVAGQPLFRNQHQYNLIIKNNLLNSDLRILDFGAAKGTIAFKLIQDFGSENIYTYDVSDSYTKFWDSKILKSNQAVNQLPNSWLGTFDLVLSIFVMEHVSDIKTYIGKVAKLLKKGGSLFAIVPNIFSNPSDILVSDHPNHFTKSSIVRLLEMNGFASITINDSSFRGALIVSAISRHSNIVSPVNEDEVSAVFKITKYWQRQKDMLRNFELTNKDKVAIYGAGVYGLFIYSILKNKIQISNFIDQNPHLIGEKKYGITIVKPEDLPNEITHVFVGLNPLIAKKSIEDANVKSNRNINFIFMEEI
jgi:2-polyprenyl-3-methyl-5-hydroxy-6-metoxy-1,4-benzoquinol methylase